MNKQYKKEKFESRNEALIWVADNKPIYDHEDDFDTYPNTCTFYQADSYWQDWCKAIEIVPKKRVIEFWVSVYSDGFEVTHKTRDEAIRFGRINFLGIVKLSKEITILDRKVFENE